MRSEDPFVKVGACALDHSNRVVGVGYNGISPGVDVTEDFWKDRDERRKFMIHAEVNCLSLVKRGQVKILACTLFPCLSCCQMISAYSIQEVVYRDVYNNDMRGVEFLKFAGITTQQIFK